MSTNYHKICVNVKAKCFFFVLRTNFNLNLSRHFYCYLSAPCVCDLGRRLKPKERGVGWTGDKLMSVDGNRPNLSHSTTHSLDSTCSNLNFIPTFSKYPPNNPPRMNCEWKKNPHTQQHFKQTNRPSQALITEWKIDWTWISTHWEISADLHNNRFFQTPFACPKVNKNIGQKEK